MKAKTTQKTLAAMANTIERFAGFRESDRFVQLVTKKAKAPRPRPLRQEKRA